MADSTKYGNAVDFDVDLHSVYAAYLGQFESAGTDWWDRSWGGYFGTFNDFLSFGWEVMVVVDSATGRAHIAVRPDQVAQFAKMIKNRFGESLSRLPPTTLPLSPVPTRTLSLRRLLIISELSAYRKLALSLPSAELSNLRSRARSGDVGLAEQLFYAGGPAGEREKGNVGVRDNGMGYTWACVKTTWWEKGGSAGGIIPGQGRVQGGREGGQVVGSERMGNGGGGMGSQNVNGVGTGPGQGAVQKGKTGGLVLEVGMAVMRCAHLRAVDVWPPVPQENYRKSHYILEEWVDKRTNSNPPSYPRAYAFGTSQWIPEKSLERIMDANLAALSSQENDASPNTLVLLTVGEPGPIPLPTWSTLPTNIIHLDVLSLEHKLLRRAQEAEIPGTPDRQTPLPSLAALLQTLQIPVPPFAPLGNAGNDAYYTLLAFQKLMMAETRLPDLLFQQPDFGFMNQMGQMGLQGMPGMVGSMSSMGLNGMSMGYGMPTSQSMSFNSPGMGMNGMNSMGSMGSMGNLANMAHRNPSHHFSPLPPPQAPFAQTSHSQSRSRRGSGSSPRHSGEIMPPPSIPTSRSGTHSGSRSPSDNSPRRQNGALPPNLRRASGSYSSVSGSKQRPASVPHHGSFSGAVMEGENGGIGTDAAYGSAQDLEHPRARSQVATQAPLRSAMRGSSSNLNVHGQADVTNSAMASRTVSWSGPPPMDMNIPQGERSGRPGAVRTDSLPDGYEAPEYMASARDPRSDTHGHRTKNSVSPIQTGQVPQGGYVNGLGNTYTRSPTVIPSSTSDPRRNGSDYFARQGSGSAINLDEAALGMSATSNGMMDAAGPASPRQAPANHRHSRTGSQTLAAAPISLNHSTGSLGSVGSPVNGYTNPSGSSTAAGTQGGSYPPSVSASTSTGARRSVARGLEHNGGVLAGGGGFDGDGSSASASGSGSASAPGSGTGPSAGSGSAQSHSQTNGNGIGQINGNSNGSNVRTLSRSNLSAMLGGQTRSDAQDRPMANRKKSKDLLHGFKADEMGRADASKEAGKGSGGKSGKEGKMKSEKSMKNVAGALARFWVG